MEEIKDVALDSPIVATSEQSAIDILLAELERRVRDVEGAVSDLRSIKAEGRSSGRKTIAAAAVIAKGDAPVNPTVDAALMSLSLEQRIAVKSGLIRAGLM